jgi:hypothetical protein
MPASLDDILTTQKNGVVAINTLGQYIGKNWAFTKGTSLSRAAMPTGSVGTLITVNTGFQYTVNDIEICNTSSSAQTFSIYLVPSGGSATAANALFYNAPIPANTTVQWTGMQVVGAGGSIQALSSSASVSIMVNGGQGDTQ